MLRSFAAVVVALAASAALGQGMCMTPPDARPIVALPSGTMIEGVGTTDLPITSRSDKAKRLVRQGYALIHCFWFNEAVRSFRDATKEDPTCAAAWLGLHASLTLPWHKPQAHRDEAEYAIKRAVATCGEATDLEQALVAAYRLRSYNVRDERESEFEKAMERVIQAHPKVNEPRLLISAVRVQLCLNDGYDENLNLREEMRKVLGWINPVLERDANNAGALHYHIHALESTNPELAVGSARRLGLSAPGSSHMVHMPGHIFNRVGMYDDAHRVFSESVKVDEVYATKIDGATPNANWNYSHNLDYLIFNLAEMGRIKEALKTAEKNPSSRRRVSWRAARWSELPQNTPFFAGMAALSSGDLAKADEEAKKLEASVELSRNQRLTEQMATRVRQERAQAGELRGGILSAQGRHDEAVKQLTDAVEAFEAIAYSEPPYYIRPPHESLGHALLVAGKPLEAAAAFERGLKWRPNSGWLLAGLATAYDRAGRRDQAAKAWGAFDKAWSGADPDLAPMRLRAAAKERQAQS